MNRQQAHYLCLVIKKIRQVPSRRIDLTVWGLDLDRCGTMGCVAGHAMTVPEIYAAGLQPSDSGSGGPVFDGWGSGVALEMFFGISAHEVRYVFYPDHYPSVAFRSETKVIYRLGSKREILKRLMDLLDAYGYDYKTSIQVESLQGVG